MKNTKGITLIALVITIIVLMILAGISIAMLTGNNGILTQAMEAEIENRAGTVEDERNLWINLQYTAKYGEDVGFETIEQITKRLWESKFLTDAEYNNGDLTDPERDADGKLTRCKAVIGKRVIEFYYISSEILGEESNIPLITEVVDTVISQTENKQVQDQYGNKMIIPAGFKVVEGLDVTEGIVVEEANSGNQFVWVPVGIIKDETGVDKNIMLSRYVFESDATAISKLNEEVISNHYKEQKISTLGNVVAKDLDDFILKSNTSGGYYIARYEASNNLGKVESVAGANVWGTTTQSEAASAAKQMYENEETFTSDLINSLAWDTALVYIQTFGKVNYSQQGRLQSTVLKTGEAKDEQLKINDMAGNFYEWSTETSTFSGKACVSRGGTYINFSPTTEHRNLFSKSDAPIFNSFRVILYL